MDQRQQLEQAIAAQENLRGTLPDAIIDVTIASLKAQLATLSPAPAEPDKQRKQVTVLFADVSGFTALSETMDAEEISDAMNALWQRVDDLIRAHNGRVDKHIGDAVMAMWGVEEAREDDPEQAIKAALAMQTAVSDFSQERHLLLKMRIGLNTGLVFLDQIRSTGEFTAMGDTVNIAARLEQAAPIGGVLISDTSYRHVRGVFDVTALAPLTVKGKKEPLRAYQVQRLKPLPFRQSNRGVEGLETKMVGREWQLSLLQETYQACLTDSKTHLVTIVGEAGVGKSRLLYEFEQWIDLRPEMIYYFKGRATVQNRGLPHLLWRDMLARRFRIVYSDDIGAVRQKFEAGIARFLPEQSQKKAHTLGAWLGFDFKESVHLRFLRERPERLHDQATLYLTQLFRAAAANSPTIIFMEDIHWADSASLEVLADLCQRCANLPLLIICLTRPSLYERHPDWDQSAPQQTRLDLTALSLAQTEMLVRDILRRLRPIPPLLLDLISQRAEGNPFYAEELVKMLIDDGVIQTSPTAWQVVAEKLVAFKVPSTLTGVLQARLDRLLAAEKLALQQASVIGRTFWDKALAELDSEHLPQLSHLENKEFIFRRADTAFANTNEYLFKHMILRDVTYETVLKSQRVQYHHIIAEWLVKMVRASRREDEFAALIGDHYQKAAQENKAAVWYGRAGQQAAATFDHRNTIRYLTLALQLAPDEAYADQYRWLMSRVQSYHLQGEREAEAADLERLTQLAARLDTAVQAQVALQYARYHEAMSQYEASIAQAERALAFAQAANELKVAAEAHYWWGVALQRQGRYPPAQAQFEQGIATAIQADMPKTQANCLRGLGTLAYYLGQYAPAQTYYEQALAIYRQIGDRQEEAGNLNNLGIMAKILGQYTAAQSYHQQALAIQQESGSRIGEALNLGNLGVVAKTLGQYDQAQAYYERSLAIAQEIGDRRIAGLAYAYLSLVAGQRGQYELALRHSQQAAKIARDIPYVLSVALVHVGYAQEWLGRFDLAQAAYAEAHQLRREAQQYDMAMEPVAGLARTALAQGDLQTAVSLAEEIEAYLGQHQINDAAEDRMRVYYGCYAVLTAAGETARARAVLQAAYEQIQAIAALQPEPLRASYLATPSHAAVIEAST